jgi:hypothetical protein
MRGHDYRAPLTGITQLIGKSFTHARDSDQGLKRVGRFNDKCWRILVGGFSLIDPIQENLYQANLLAVCVKMTAVKNTQFKPLGSMLP